MKHSFVISVAFLTGAACLPPQRIQSPSAALARLEKSNEVVFGFELVSQCNLERSPGETLATGGWTPLDVKSISNSTFHILDHATQLPVSAGREHVSAALKFKSPTGELFWVRNAPTDTVEQATALWRCAYDQGTVTAGLPLLKAAVVQLAVASNECTSIAPIFGDITSLTFSPYTVTGRTLFSTKDGALVGVRLEAEGGEKAITVPARVFDKCFAPADRAPPPPQEAEQLSAWLKDGASIPPGVSSDTVQLMTGLKLDRCLREGTGLTTHWECRTPILRVMASKDAGPYGPPTIRVEHQRFADALHLYAKRLVSPADVIGVNAAVRLHASSAAVTKAFNSELEKSLVDPAEKQRRAGSGFRLLRASDVAAGVPATHFVDMDLTFNIPEMVVTTETRTHTYVAGQKTIANAKYAEAQRTSETKRRELQSAKQALESAEHLAEEAGKAANDLCKKGAGKAAENLPWGLGGVASVAAGSACKEGTKALVTGAEKSAVERKQKELEESDATLQSTPATVTADEERSFSYQAKVFGRSGDATAKVNIATAGSGISQMATTVTFHFEASDSEYAGSPEHQLPARTAKVPTAEDVERQLAISLLPRIDEAVLKWAAQRQVGGDIGDLQPGTRSWMVAVARNAASDRPVKLLSDVLETRPDQLEKKTPMQFPVKMPAVLAGRCFTFAAIPLDPMADVNLELGRFSGTTLIAHTRDDRSTSEAAFEACDLPPGEYAVEVSFSAGKISKKGVLVSMFESTPGAVTNLDTIAASRGIPTKTRKGEDLALNGEGIVQFRGTSDKVVTGKTGDRDGDGILDDDDRCPYDPETKNGYLDEDGCPDVPPAAPADGAAR